MMTDQASKDNRVWKDGQRIQRAVILSKLEKVLPHLKDVSEGKVSVNAVACSLCNQVIHTYILKCPF